MFGCIFITLPCSWKLFLVQRCIVGWQSRRWSNSNIEWWVSNHLRNRNPSVFGQCLVNQFLFPRILEIKVHSNQTCYTWYTLLLWGFWMGLNLKVWYQTNRWRNNICIFGERQEISKRLVNEIKRERWKMNWWGRG